mgnify:CR=1 FL=1
MPLKSNFFPLNKTSFFLTAIVLSPSLNSLTSTNDPLYKIFTVASYKLGLSNDHTFGLIVVTSIPIFIEWFVVKENFTSDFKVSFMKDVSSFFFK